MELVGLHHMYGRYFTELYFDISPHITKKNFSLKIYGH
jgi:hypothetical protein